MLSLTGIDVPDYMRGRPFLGESETDPRSYVFGHRDRVDEAIDMSRSVRDKQYLYVRHFMPHISYNQQTAWPDQGEIRHEFYRMAESGEMTDAQRQFAGPTKPIEALYDTDADPLNLNNLADSPEHRDLLRQMRETLRAQLIAERDLGFVPEIEMLDYTDGTTPYEWARSGAYDIEAYLSAAEAVGTDNFEQFSALLQDERTGVRYWGAMGYTAATEVPANALDPLPAALDDPSPAVQIEAASALIKHGSVDEGLTRLRELLDHEDPIVVMYAARAIEMAGDKAKAAYSDMQALYETNRDRTDDPYLFIGFAAKGYLDRVEP